MSEQQLMVVLGADTSDFTRAMASIQAQMRQTANSIERSMNKAEGSVDKKTSQMGGHFDKLKGIMGGIGKGLNMGGIVGGLSTAVPILATATAGVGALGSAFMGAGVGVAGFGAVAVSALNDVFSATDETFGNLSAEQQKAYKSLEGFKSFWKGFAKEFEKPIVGSFTKGIDALQNILVKIKPAIGGTATAIEGLMTSLNKSLDSPDMVKFFDYIGKSAGMYVTQFGLIFGNTFRAIANLMTAFAPISEGVITGLAGMTKSFADWTSGLAGSKGFQQFIDYAKTNAPIVTGLIGSISKVVWDLIVILAPLGQTFLGIFGQIGSALSNFTGQVKSAFSAGNFTGVGQVFGQLVTTIGSVLLSSIPQLVNIAGEMIAKFAFGISSQIPVIVETIVGLISAIIDNISVNYPLLISAGLSLITSLLEGIVSALPQLISSAVFAIQALVGSISTGIATYLPQIIQAGIQLILSLIQGFVTALPQIVQSVITLVTTILNTLLTQLPVLLTAGIQILQAVIQGIVTMLPQLITMAIQLVQTVMDMIVANLPMIIDAGIQLLNALIDGVLGMLPQLITLAISLIDKVATILLENLPMIISAGMELLVALVNGIANALPQLVTMAVSLILKLAGTIIQHLPQIITAGVQILLALIDGLIKTIPTLVGTIPQIVTAIFDAFADVDWAGIGKDILSGIGKGITKNASQLFGTVKEIAGGLLDAGKKKLGIHSPSKEFAKHVGQWIPKGIAVGVKANGNVAMDAVEDVNANLLPSSNDMQLSSWLNPLPKMGASDMGGTSNPITNHYTINATIREEADIDKITKGIVREQQKLNRAGGRVSYGY